MGTVEFIIQTIVRTALSVLIGGLIGSERARHGRSAGMRTHMLVCLGACMTSLTSAFVSQYLGMQGDVFRIPAQVISGVGFLGAGMIILRNNNTITGLTTAAGVWTTGTIGIALGFGFFSGAIIVTVLYLAAILIFAQFEKSRKNAEVIYIELDDMCKVNAVLSELGKITAQSFSSKVSVPKSNKSGNLGLTVTFEKCANINISDIEKIPNVAFAILDQD